MAWQTPFPLAHVTSAVRRTAMPVRGYPDRARSNPPSQPPPPCSAGLAGRDKQRNRRHKGVRRRTQERIHQSMSCPLGQCAIPPNGQSPAPPFLVIHSAHIPTQPRPPDQHTHTASPYAPRQSPCLARPTHRPASPNPSRPRSFNLIVRVHPHEKERRIIRNGHGVRWHRHRGLRCQPVRQPRTLTGPPASTSRRAMTSRAGICPPPGICHTSSQTHLAQSRQLPVCHLTGPAVRGGIGAGGERITGLSPSSVSRPRGI